MKIGIAVGTIVPKILVLSVALVLIISNSASRVYGQARPSPAENVISIDPLPVLSDGPLSLQYEYKTGPVNSWAFRFLWWPNPSSQTGWSGFGVGAAYRFYIADSRALTGLSVAPAADIYFFKLSSLNQASTCIDLGGDLAYKWIFDDFAVEPLFGFRWGTAVTTSAGATAPTRITGIAVIIGLSGGYAF